MKSISFNRNNSLLRNMEEAPIPKKKINWDKIIYFLVLFLIIFFIFKYMFVRAVYEEAPGHVLFKSLRIRIPEDITLEEFYKEEGDNVEIGDTIFSYYSYKEQQDASINIINKVPSATKTDNSWITKEIYTLNKNISINKVSILEKQELITWYRAEIATLKNEVILEITPKNKIETYQKEIEKLELNVNSLSQKNIIFSNLITELKNSLNRHSVTTTNSNIANASSDGVSSQPKLKYYLSPLTGTVTRLYKNNYEVALKSENILNMHERKDIYIKAFFDQSSLAYINIGDKVNITFPNGETSTGHINRFYFATYKMPSEFQKKYESTKRAIAVDIFPIEDESKIKWKAFYKMNVKISINKY